MIRERRLALSVAAVSAAILAFQIVVMQLLAIAQWQLFAALVISVALLGFGAAGTALALWRTRLVRRYDAVLPLLLLATGATMAATVWLAGTFGRFDAYLLLFDAPQLGRLALAIGVYTLPFFFGGLAVTLVFDREVGRIGALYFANMVGSGIGAAGVIVLLWLAPPERLAGVLALLPLLAAWLVRPAARAAGAAPGGFALPGVVALGVAVAAIVAPSEPRPSQYKAISAALLLPDAQVVDRSHGPFGRVEVVRAPALRFAPALSLRSMSEPPVRDVLFVDGQAFGTLLGRADPAAGHVLDQATNGLPYALRRPASVLVVDAGTGVDVSHALAHGAGRITAVESNRQVLGLLRDRHPEWVDGLYRDPAVRVVEATARGYLGSRAGDVHDLVVLPVHGAFGGTSGVHALREHYALTAEAFDAIWRSLSDRGLIAWTVWDDQPPRTTLRALATLRALLDRQGAADPTAHLAAVRSWGTVTFVASRTPWTAAEVGRMRDFAAERGFDLLVLPGRTPDEADRFNRLPDRSFVDAVDTLANGDPRTVYAASAFDFEPTTDDRPFFDRFVRASSLPALAAAYGLRELPYLELGTVFGVVGFVLVVVAALGLIVLPLARLGWAGTRRRYTLLTFAGTGAGFMLFEIVLMQELVLYLGHPVYAAAAVLTALLVGAGAGSLASSRLDATPKVIAAAALVVVALIALYAPALGPLLGLTMGWPLAAKAAAVLVVLGPPALVMGTLFPLGLRRLAAGDDAHIPWACGIDSSVSVAAAAGAPLLAVQAGFGAVLAVAAAAYLVVAFAGPRLGRGG